MTSAINPWGRSATLGLGIIALLVGQLAGLIVLAWWSGVSLTSLSDFANGVARSNRWAENKTDQLPELTAELIRRG